ncbi:MAG: M48 family metallopeptidase [Legionellales bacterium]|nr:M48 family metallopeptidase [Legionellales bacterium]
MKKNYLTIENLNIEVKRTSVKHTRLTISPPHGHLSITAPFHISDQQLHHFVSNNLDKIHRHIAKIKSYVVLPASRFINNEMHVYFGQSYTLKLIEATHAGVMIVDNRLIMYTKAGSTREDRLKILNTFYQQQLCTVINELMKKWQPIVGKHAENWVIRKMKARWGSCHYQQKKIIYNLELAKKSIEHIEYVVVHELTHLHEPNHSQRFYQLMTQFLPQWKTLRHELNHPTYDHISHTLPESF